MNKSGWQVIEVTVDIGACEAVIPPKCCEHVQVVPPEASRTGPLRGSQRQHGPQREGEALQGHDHRVSRGPAILQTMA